MKNIEKLILKYGLVLNEESSRVNNDKRYTWNNNKNMVSGDVLGIDIVCSEGKGTRFAQDIHFEKGDDFYPTIIKCYAWEQVPEELWEEKLKALRAEYDYAVLRYKHSKMESKLKNIKKDF